MMALGAICSFRSTTRMVLSKSGKHLIRNKKFLSTVRVNLTKVNITGLEYTNLFEASSLLNINIVKTNYRYHSLREGEKVAQREECHESQSRNFKKDRFKNDPDVRKN